MINKKLIHFDKNSDFEQQKENGNILDTSIVFIKDRNKIHTHSTEYQFIKWSYIDAPQGYTSYLLQDNAVWRDSDNEIIFVKDGI